MAINNFCCFHQLRNPTTVHDRNVAVLHRACPLSRGGEPSIRRCHCHLLRRIKAAGTPPSLCDSGCSERRSRRSRKPHRPTKCRAGISDRYNRRLRGGSHTRARHRRRSCDEAPEKSAALRRRTPGTLIDPVQSACCGTPRAMRSVMFSKARRYGPARLLPRQKTRCSACERRP
jgi:hypothetical protein